MKDDFNNEANTTNQTHATVANAEDVELGSTGLDTVLNTTILNTTVLNSMVLTEQGQSTLRRLLSVWFDFEKKLNKVSIVRRLMNGTFTHQDYMNLLKNLRPQVIEGGRWISRCASSFDRDFSDVRSLIIGHAQEEHRDYLLLEQDYVALGGKLEDIQQQARNPGSEALHSYMMYQSGIPNPAHMLGAMWIIEGLGNKMANEWAAQIEALVPDSSGATLFLRYHGDNDEDHLQKLYQMIDRLCVNESVTLDVIKTATVVGRLYALQLEEVDFGGDES